DVDGRPFWSIEHRARLFHAGYRAHHLCQLGSFDQLHKVVAGGPLILEDERPQPRPLPGKRRPGLVHGALRTSSVRCGGSSPMDRVPEEDDSSFKLARPPYFRTNRRRTAMSPKPCRAPPSGNPGLLSSTVQMSFDAGKPSSSASSLRTTTTPSGRIS